jgi:hypothetical protein
MRITRTARKTVWRSTGPVPSSSHPRANNVKRYRFQVEKLEDRASPSGAGATFGPPPPEGLAAHGVPFSYVLNNGKRDFPNETGFESSFHAVPHAFGAPAVNEPNPPV